MAELQQAYQYCREITIRHYENFPVASRLLPGKIRRHIYPIYAFARIADDFADEEKDAGKLVEWRNMLLQCYQDFVEHPVFVALNDTVRKFQLPWQLFDDLLKAFQQDIQKTRYANLEELIQYCRFSANPVGRIILCLHKINDERLFAYSDNICTGLQLINFWQDVNVDLQKGRIYIPLNLLHKFEIEETELLNRQYSKKFASLMSYLVDYAEGLLIEGAQLVYRVPGRLKWELKFIIAGGLRVLDKIRGINYNVIEQRVTLTRRDWLTIAIQLITKNFERI